MRCVSVELGHRILKTEEPQEPENLISGPPAPQLPGPRVAGLTTGGWILPLVRGQWALPCVSGRTSSTTTSKAPHFLGLPASLLPLGSGPKGLASPRRPSPPHHLRCPPRTLTSPWQSGVDPEHGPCCPLLPGAWQRGLWEHP